ncbi:hypothetical protein Bca4012_065910 [Brassica carinata]
MLTGLKCSGEVEGPRGENQRFEWDLLKGRTHKLKDVVNQLRNTREDASEERFCLAMLLLDITYPWGKEAYIILLKSIQNAVANHLEDTSKFEVQGYPLVFHLWILESIPLLWNTFSKWAPTPEVPGPTYLCEKYTEVDNPSLERVLQIEAHAKLKVTCILSPIPHDLEDDVSMEDKHSDELQTLKDISKKEYKFTADDWKNRSVDTFDTLDALIQMMGNEETSQDSVSIEEESLKARVSELEGNQNVGPHTQTVVFPTNVTQQVEKEPSDDTPALDTQVFTPNFTREVKKEPSDDTPALDTQVITPNLTQEMVTQGTYEITEPLTEIISANNKKEDTHAVHNTPSSPISSQISLVLEENKNALTDTETVTQYFSLSEKEPSDETPSEHNQAEENLQVTTEPTTEIISTDVSKTQPLNQQTEHLQKSERETSDKTPSEQNQAEENLQDTTEPTTEIISTDTTEPTTETQPLNQQTEHLQKSAIDFSETEKAEENRLPTLFEIGADVEIASNDDTTSRIWYPAKVVDVNGVEKGFYKNGWYSGQIKMVLGDNTYSVYLNSSMETIQFEPSHLQIHREWIDGVWKMADEMQTCYFKGPETQSQDLSQQDHVIEEKPNKKRKDAGSSQELGKDTYVPFLRRSERVPKRSRDTKTPFKSERNPALTVKLEIIYAVDPFSTPADHKFQRLQNWLTSTGGVHGVTLLINKTVTRKSFFQYIENEGKDLRAVHIDGAFATLNCRRNENAAWFHNNKIPKAYFLPTTFFPTLGYYIDLSETRPAEVLIPALMMEAFGEEVNKKEVVPYKIEKAEGIPKTHFRFNCALFVLKMLECHSLKIEDMSKINDDNAMELRRILSCEIFNQFVDANV